MDRELTFYPETERTRDLVYSEYSSCDRSIHLLVQENTIVPYEFLLKTYRETISRYLSSEKLNLPLTFLKELLEWCDAECSELGITIDDFKGTGVHVLLRSAETVLLFTSIEKQVFLCSDGEIVPLEESFGGGVERVSFDEDNLQKELFPQQVGDLFAVFKLDPGAIGDKDLVLGCVDEERGTVLEALSGPMWLESGPAEESNGSGRSIISKFISKKVLVVRFAALKGARVGQAQTTRLRKGHAGRKITVRRRFVVAAAAVIVAVLIGVLWTGEQAGDGEQIPMDMIETEIRSEAEDTGQLAEPAADNDEKTAVAEKAKLVLVTEWKNTYEDQVTSSPAILGELVVFGCRDGNLYAVKRDTGNLVWKYATSAGIGASPATDGKNVVIGDYNGNVYVLTGATGEQIWNRKLPMKVVSSPVISGEYLLVGCYDGYVYCLSIVDGRNVWKRKTKGRIRGSLAALDDTFFVPSYDGYLYALSRGAGNILWRTNLGGQLSGSPAVGDDVVVTGTPNGRVHCVEIVGGTRRWTFSTGAAVKSWATIASGKVFVGSNDGYLYCLNPGDGALLWRFKTGDLVLGRPFVRDGVVYFGSYDGKMYAVDAENGQLLDSFNAGGAVYSSPAVDGEKVYFGTNRGDFFCLTHHGEKTS